LMIDEQRLLKLRRLSFANRQLSTRYRRRKSSESSKFPTRHNVVLDSPFTHDNGPLRDFSGHGDLGMATQLSSSTMAHMSMCQTRGALTV
jgi:hypothetical protein